MIDELFFRGLRMSKMHLKIGFSINCYSFENLDQDDEVRDRELFEYLLIWIKWPKNMGRIMGMSTRP